MQVMKTSKAYTFTRKCLHWVIAFLAIFLLGLGLYMVRQPPTPITFERYDLHKSLGVLLLFLALIRSILVLKEGNPPLLLPKLQRILAKAVHGSLYLLLLLMPLSGWLMSNAGNHPISFFGFFELPALVNPNTTLKILFHALHEWLAYFLIVLIVFHTLAALKHHFIDKDDILKRML